MAYSRTTRLDAINTILTSSQLSTVESLSSGDVDSEIAENILDEICVEIQTIGWYWNTEVFELSPDNDGNILLPSNCLKIDATDTYLDVVQRGSKLYNKETHSYSFSKPLELEIVLALDFEELPQSCRRYITMKSAMIFQERTVGDPTIVNALNQEAMQAWGQMKKEELDVVDYNGIYDSASSANIMRRVSSTGW